MCLSSRENRRHASQSQPDSAHPVSQLPRTAGVELAAQEMADLAGLGMELLCQNLHRIALACKPRFEVIKFRRQGRGNEGIPRSLEKAH